MTISYRGGRWRAAFSVRYRLGGDGEVPTSTRRRAHGGIIGIDAGVAHLATCSVPVPGLSDEEGHIANPRILDAQLRRLRRLDRVLARCERGSKTRARLRRRRARLHGAITKTRALELHRFTNELVARFGAIAFEDLNVAAMVSRKRHLGRALADASLGELRRQLSYKAADRGVDLVVVDRFYPSSKTCSCCGVVKAKLLPGGSCVRHLQRGHRS